MNARRDDEGAVAAIVAMCLLLVFAAGAIAIDLGSAYETKRDLVVDTDSAALAGARALHGGDCSAAETAAEGFLSANLGETVDLTAGTDFECTPGTGPVRVDFTGQATKALSDAIGAGDLDVFSSSTAQLDYDTGNLRPLSTCVDSPLVASMARTEVTFDGGSATLCSSTSGNWGWLCFDDKDCETGHPKYEDADDLDCSGPDSLLAYLRCGFGGDHPTPRLFSEPSPLSSPWTPDDEDCTWDSPNPDTESYSGEIPATNDWCWTKPGVNVGELADIPAGHQRAIDVALDDEVFPILLFDKWRPAASGREVVHPKAYLWIRFHGYCLNADNYGGSWPESRRHDCSGSKFIFDIEPLAIQWSDVPPAAVFPHLEPTVTLCGVDHDPNGGDRCGP